VLQGRLSRVSVASVAIVLLTGACASVDGTDRGAIRENVIEPGITAIDQSTKLACDQDASALRTALEVYETLEGSPAPDQAALVDGQFLREPSERWDVVDGRLVPTDPACGDVTAPVPTEQIVTSTEPVDATDLGALTQQVESMTADDILATVSPEEIAAVGGPECAYEVAEVGLAVSRWLLRNSDEPVSLRQLLDSGDLGPLELWTVTDDSLEAVPGTPCIGPLPIVGSGG
jgi:hypothetical protein